MNLSDQDILDLNELCNGLVDDTLGQNQKAQLSRWLATSEPARRFYVRAMGLSASLYSYAQEMQVEAPDETPAPLNLLRWGAGPLLSSLAAAACVALVFWTFGGRQRNAPSAEGKAGDYVAQLTGAKQCQWVSGSPALRTERYLRRGQQLKLAKGFAEITFDSGAQVVLEGPAVLDINSAWDATLRRGTLKANVPLEAMGFRISNPAVEVVDLGTEFEMIADASGAADVLVLKGTVETSSRGAADPRTLVLHEQQSRHFAQTGITSVNDGEQKFARFSQPVPLDHFLPATAYVHWSFDETDGSVLKADSFGAPLAAFDAQLGDVAETEVSGARTGGRWRGALRFNGRLFAKAFFPGISGNSPRTVVFWVKVPEEAQLPNAYAMVAWGANSQKLRSHPVHIGWNRNPTEGSVGVLRTDYGGGFALGATPLRDGRWHHVAVVFVPGEDFRTPVEVKQYVDGRFEGEGKPSPPGTVVSEKFSAQNATSVGDTLWLGCRLGENGPRRDRFRGDMDELCIANRALSPREIVQLMKDNKPSPGELALAMRSAYH